MKQLLIISISIHLIDRAKVRCITDDLKKFSEDCMKQSSDSNKIVIDLW